MESSQTQVLIVGAGPTGLSLAAALAKRGVQVKIIDKSKARSDKSKALGIQAGTLEVLAETFGEEIPQRLVEKGRELRKVNFHFDGRSPLEVDVGKMIPSKHNFILLLEQSETERQLEELLESLDVRVQRETELTTFAQVNGGCIARVRHADGSGSEIQSKYIVGCDGAHSTVRKILEVPFEGGAYEGDFVLADVRVDWKWPTDTLRIFVSGQGILACFPFKEEGLFRLITIEKPSGPVKSDEVTLAEFQTMASEMTQASGTEIKLSQPRWLTRFRVHHRMTNCMQKGRVFLAGDSAHIHSPAGGQGMNIGIEDALNLAFKMSEVLSGRETPAMFADYEMERMPVARNILKYTDIPIRLALMPDNRLTKLMRSAVVPAIASVPMLQKTIAKAISQISMARDEMRRRLT